MAQQFLSKDGLLYFWQKIKNNFARTSHTHTKSEITDFPAIPEGVSPYNNNPAMDGTASAGSSALFARGDHVHPSDTTKVDKVTGKGLSTNDYTTAEQIKLSGIATGADVTQFNLAREYDNGASVVYAQDTVRFFGDEFVDVSAGYAQDDAPMVRMQIKSNKINVASGLLKLDSSGKVPNTLLPSYVDDVIEAYARPNQTELSSTWLATGSASGTVITPESGKIYILMADSSSYVANTQFRWGGSTYVRFNDGGVSVITNAEIDEIIAS